MAFAFQAHYPPEVAAQVRAFYATLSEGPIPKKGPSETLGNRVTHA